MAPHIITASINDIARNEWGRLISSLMRSIGDFQLAEDSLQEAFTSALNHWQKNGLPKSPNAWLLQVARRKAIDHIRRDVNFKSKQAEISHLIEIENSMEPDAEDHEIPDERLRMIFTCCHPSLEKQSALALTLRTLGGLKTDEIASAFVAKESAVAQRLVRAKSKIKLAGIPYKVPEPEEWDERLGLVLAVIYHIFSEGYSANSGDSQIRKSLSDEAIRLAEILNQLKPEEPEIEGLLALLLLHDSRREARLDENDFMVPLEEQDRSHWDREKINTGIQMLKAALVRGKNGPYQIQAAISAVHAQAANYDDTDWRQIILLYDALYDINPNTVVLLNKAVAVSYLEGPESGLKLIEKLENDLKTYQPFHAAKADLLRRMERFSAAVASYNRAIELTRNAKDKAFLQKRLKQFAN